MSCLVFPVMIVCAVPEPAEDKANGYQAPPYHQLHLGIGGSREGAFMLFSWTGKRRLGVYFKPHLLDDDQPVRANSTVVEESAGELGLTFRLNRALTIGAGYGSFDREISVYGDPSIIFGIPYLLEESEERNTGPAGFLMLTIPTAGDTLGWSFALSGGPTGAGISIQVALRI